MSPAELTLLDSPPGAQLRPVPVATELRVAVADGQALVRAGMRALLEDQDGIVVAAEAADADELVALVRTARPDVLLIDLDLPGADAIDVTRLLLADPAFPHTRVVMLTALHSDPRVLKAVRAGATGCVVKDSTARELVEALHSVSDGHAALSPTIARRVVDELASLPEENRPTPDDLEELTPREREVVALVAGGLNNAEIAERLVVSRATAKTHVSRALRKLPARDRAELVTIAYETGLVVPGPQRRTRTGAPISAAA